VLCWLFHVQKARQARIRMAKNASQAEFMRAKKRHEEAMRAEELGLEVDSDHQESIFSAQHHHLLTCLENTTVRTGRLGSRQDPRPERWQGDQHGRGRLALGWK
jgi:hypothetical protein